ncbi:hypothetical protein B0I35DRAFT_478234 [Stachybotrys elegans]|uniref:Integrase catalytic domain-containing protein n=1 Tax=Stachybotrys elegans TaxID=80388 RepID=A0A8K0SU14_9HYPO|nr:hypothetical protein B0I35DRAFT_478234 [Stachybotrys elegans]
MTNATETVSQVVKWLAHLPSSPIAFYTDPGSTFRSVEFTGAFTSKGISCLQAPTKSHKSVGRIEVYNCILQDVLGKTLGPDTDWVSYLSGVSQAMNSRVVQSLGYSPAEILYGIDLRIPLDKRFPPLDTSNLKGSLEEDRAVWGDCEEAAEAVVQFVASREAIRRYVDELEKRELDIRQERHDLSRYAPYHPGHLVMVLQEGKPKKLRPRWTGPFRIQVRVGRASYSLENVNGTPIAVSSRRLYDYHYDHLKPFFPRTGRLATPGEDLPPTSKLR